MINNELKEMIENELRYIEEFDCLEFHTDISNYDYVCDLENGMIYHRDEIEEFPRKAIFITLMIQA